MKPVTRCFDGFCRILEGYKPHENYDLNYLSDIAALDDGASRQSFWQQLAAPYTGCDAEVIPQSAGTRVGPLTNTASQTPSLHSQCGTGWDFFYFFMDKEVERTKTQKLINLRRQVLLSLFAQPKMA